MATQISYLTQDEEMESLKHKSLIEKYNIINGTKKHDGSSTSEMLAVLKNLRDTLISLQPHPIENKNKQNNQKSSSTVVATGNDNNANKILMQKIQNGWLK